MKLTTESISFINLFEKITKARVKDCIINEGKLIFIVNSEDMSKAIGKQGINVKRAKNLMKKDIQIVAFNENINDFVSNLIYPNKAEVKLENKIITLSIEDNSTKGKILGRNRDNLKRILSILQRYFDVEEIKIA